MGNTSADIANALVGIASEVYLSHSRGAHVVRILLLFPPWHRLSNTIFLVLMQLPRDHNGVPATSVLTHRLVRLQGTIDWIVPRLRDFISGQVLRKMTRTVFGELDPAWRLDDAPPATVTNPIINDELIPNLRAGSLMSVAGIQRITGPETVELADGSTVGADVIVCCVGYENNYDVLAPNVNPIKHDSDGSSYRSWAAARGSRGRPLPRLYQNVFSIDRPDSLAFVGCAWFATGAFTVADIASMCITQVWRGKSRLPPPSAMERWMDGQTAWLTGLAKRGTIVPATVNMRAWLVWADETAGMGVEEHVAAWWSWKSWVFWWRERELYGMIDRGVFTSAVWRLFRGGKRKAWEGARDEVRRLNDKHQASLERHRRVPQ